MPKKVIASEFDAARQIEQCVLDELARHDYGEDTIFAIRLALEESLNNAVKHGNRLDPSKTIEIDFQINARQTSITVKDQGNGFAPCDIPDPTADENLEKPNGRGVMLMRAYMDEVSFNDRGNEVYMLKHNN